MVIFHFWALTVHRIYVIWTSIMHFFVFWNDLLIIFLKWKLDCQLKWTHLLRKHSHSLMISKVFSHFFSTQFHVIFAILTFCALATIAFLQSFIKGIPLYSALVQAIFWAWNSLILSHLLYFFQPFIYLFILEQNFSLSPIWNAVAWS